MPDSGEAPVDLEAPFCIEVAAGSFSRMHALLEQVSAPIAAQSSLNETTVTLAPVCHRI